MFAPLLLTSATLGLLLLILIISTCDSSMYPLHKMEALGCTYKRVAKDLQRDVVIGALFPVHHDIIKGRYTINVNSIAWVESFLFAIAQINNNTKLLPDISLGYVVKDTCNDEELALRQALSFMVDTQYFRDRKQNDNQTNERLRDRKHCQSNEHLQDQKQDGNPRNELIVGGDENDCDDPNGQSGNGNRTMCVCWQKKRRIIASAIGCDLSTVSHHVAMLTRTDSFPQISPFSVNPELSYIPNFLRTVPSDIYQTSAIADLLQHFNWTYVSVLAADDDYGRFAIDILVRKMKDRGMCTGIEKIFDPHFPSKDMEKLISDIRTISVRSNVIVLWCDVSEAIHIINETHNAGVRNITWIGAEIWGRHRDLRKLSVTIPMMRLISLSMESEVVPDFEKHFKDIDYYSNLGNPWFKDVWSAMSRCPPKDEPQPPPWRCTPDYPTTQDIPNSQHENVMYAVYAIATGLHSYFNCTQTVCRDKGAVLDYQRLLPHIKNASFRIPSSSSVFRFDSKGDRTVTSYTYHVREFNTKLNRKGKLVKRLTFKQMGRWNGETKSSTINMTILNETWGHKPLPVATCSQPCKPGTFKVNGSTTCCWKCPRCSANEISKSTNQQKCQECGKTEASNEERTACIPLKDQRLTIGTISGKLLSAFASLGIICIAWVISVYRKHWETPVVKSSSREISIIQLILMLVLFCLPVFDMLPVTKAVCIAKTTVFGLLYSQVIAFLVMKTYRLYCVFNTQFTQISKLLKNKYQIFFSFGLIVPQILLIVTWYILVDLEIDADTFPARGAFVWHCGASEDYLIYAMTGYIVLLSIVGGFMAFRARKLPENYKETLTIFYAMFTNIFLWLPVFLLCYMLSPYRDNQIIVFITINMAGNFSLLVVLYGSKLIIILLYPELNSKEHFRQMAASNTMLTFLKDCDPKTFGQKRVSQQAVLDNIDFDAMFNEYKAKRTESLPKTKITISNTIKRLDRHMTFKRRTSSSTSSASKSKISPMRERKRGSNLPNLESVNSTFDDEERYSSESETSDVIVENNNNYDGDNNLNNGDKSRNDRDNKSSTLSVESSEEQQSNNNAGACSCKSNPSSSKSPQGSPASRHRVRPPSPLCRIESDSNPTSPSYTIGRNVVIHNIHKSPTHSSSSVTLDVPNTPSPPPCIENKFIREIKEQSLPEESNLSRDNSLISLIRKEQKNINRPVPNNVFEFQQQETNDGDNSNRIITSL